MAVVSGRTLASRRARRALVKHQRQIFDNNRVEGGEGEPVQVRIRVELDAADKVTLRRGQFECPGRNIDIAT